MIESIVGKKVVIWEERLNHISQTNGHIISLTDSIMKVVDTFGDIHNIPIAEVQSCGLYKFK